MSTFEHASTLLRDKLHALQVRIHAACLASGRPAGSVQLLAVSKTFSADDVRQVAACGQRDFGENYIQEGVDKIIALQDSQPALVWHCIGPMQSNKTKLVAEHFDWAHTVDRLKIAQRLSDQRPAHLAPLNVCLQVNIDGGATKSGLAPDEVLALATEVAKLPRLALRGLMTIPDPVDGFEAQVAVHAKARALFDMVKAALNLPHFDTLSMGMTGDLDAAVQAGSTMVRVGTAIFGGRAYAA
ncbi:YggS family pyridoxal phosphate-dependent enzyme [Limnohabitans sp.]|uniref:YggS family pyridoxal phosphate-dependent enzyme n=1 Tax=Limnohabitans sp. TaxID=1907725 RepID=UPI002FDC9E93